MTSEHPEQELPTVMRHEGRIRRIEDAPLPERNACGFRNETVAAEYETDAALAEAENNMEDPYFLAAFKAEDELRLGDQDPATHPLDCNCIFCIPGA